MCYAGRSEIGVRAERAALIHVVLYLHQQANFQRKLESFLGVPFRDAYRYDLKGDVEIHSLADVEQCLSSDSRQTFWDRGAGRWVLHGPNLAVDQERPPAYVLHRPRNLADTKRRCAWLADHYAWSIVLWCDDSYSRTLGLVTSDDGLRDRFLQAAGNEFERFGRVNLNIVGSYSLTGDARGVFPTAVLDEYRRGLGDVGRAVWEACDCKRIRPLVSYWHFQDASDDARGTWVPLRYDVVAIDHEASVAIYRPDDIESFVGMCGHGIPEHNNQSPGYVIAVSGDVQPTRLLELVDARQGDLRPFWSPLSELPLFLEIAPWFYNAKPLVEGFDYAVFSARDPSLTGYVATEARRVFDGEDVTVAFF